MLSAILRHAPQAFSRRGWARLAGREAERSRLVYNLRSIPEHAAPRTVFRDPGDLT
jgi:hypothetical protein